jgi:hypothetical protein
MCLSQTVSFIGGGALLAGGAYSARRALQINPRYLPASLMPMLAGVQQFFEGHVWMGLNRADASMISWAALSFVFFSWLAWPVLVPLLAWILEPDARKKRIMLAFAFTGAVLGLTMFFPYVWYPDWLTVSIARHSIAYGDRMLTDSFMPREVTYFIYLAIIITPPLLSSHYHMRMFGLTLIGIVLTTYFLLYYAYISFFCFLAAAGTIHLIYIILGDKCCIKYCPVPLPGGQYEQR